MTTDIKELVKRLKEYGHSLRAGLGFKHMPELFNEAADALEAMAGEVGRLKATFNTATVEQILKATQARAEAAESERDRLKAALQPFSDAYERLVRTQESMGFGDNATFGLGIKVSAIKAARKALGGDAS